MRVGILGTDRAFLPAVAQWQLADGPRVVRYCSLGEDCGWLTALVPNAEPTASWEDFLDERQFDLVLAGAQVPEDALRALVQQAMPVAVAFPWQGPILTWYELAITQEEKRGSLAAYRPWRASSKVAEAKQALAQAMTAGGEPAFHLQLTRTGLAPDQSNAWKLFAQDVDLIRFLAGPAKAVQALGSGSPEKGFSHLACQLTGAGGWTADWTWQTTEVATGTLRLETAGKTHTWELPRDWLGTAVGGEDGLPGPSQNGLQTEASNASWLDACRSMELVDTARISREKGKSQRVSEEGQGEVTAFKGVMATTGCLILLLLVPLFVLASLAQSIGLLPRWWLWPVLAVLVLFLAMQSLRWLAQGPSGSAPNADKR